MYDKRKKFIYQFLNQNITSTPPVAEKSISFDGSSTYVQLGMVKADIDTLIGGGTITTMPYFTIAWDMVVPSDVGLSKTIIGFARTAGSVPRWEIRTHDTNADRLWLNIRNDAFTTTGIKASAKQFDFDTLVHCAMVCRERTSFSNPWITYDLYIDGVLAMTYDKFENGTFTWATAAIGAVLSNTTQNYAKLKMDNLRLFNRNLSGAEVAGLYGGSPTTSGLVAYYKFEDDYTDEQNNYDGTASTPAPSFVDSIV